MRKRVSHACRVLSSPWPGVFGTDIDSARQYDRHWHTTFGFGLMERGAHRSMSGRGIVDAQAGEVITTNPGEVHDGRPLGGASRRWRMIYLDPAVMASMAGRPETPAADVRLTRPVIQDTTLIPALRQLLRRLERWQRGPAPLARRRPGLRGSAGADLRAVAERPLHRDADRRSACAMSRKSASGWPKTLSALRRCRNWRRSSA